VWRAAKPHVAALMLLTTLAAMLMGGAQPGRRMAAVLASTALTLCGAAILNNHLERATDARMERTRSRPTASGELGARPALAVGLVSVAVGVATLALSAGPVAAGLAATGAAAYVIVYTLIVKPRTPMSSVPGAVCGLFPPLIGWAATGAPWSADIVVLCAAIFLWSPPHFWSLAFALKSEYETSGIPTPAVAYGERVAALQVLVFVAALVAITVLPTPSFGLHYLLIALPAGGVLLLLAGRLARRRTRESAWLLYKASGPYLAVVVAAMVLESL
jgi:heme o synthase